MCTKGLKFGTINYFFLIHPFLSENIFLLQVFVVVKCTVVSNTVWSIILIDINEPVIYHQFCTIDANVDTIKKTQYYYENSFDPMDPQKGLRVPPGICRPHFESHCARLSDKYEHYFRHWNHSEDSICIKTLLVSLVCSPIL